MLCTEEYRKQQEALHAKGGYGVMGERYGSMVSQIVDRLQIDHVLDYGCGKNLSLTKTLKPRKPYRYQAYDIGVPEYSGDPVPAEMVCCIDMLEHSEPECLEDILDHLEELTELVLFATIHTGPAAKTLPDGRNAHLIQQPMEWWLPKIWERFTIQTFQLDGPGFWVIAQNRNLPVEGSRGEQPKESLLVT